MMRHFHVSKTLRDVSSLGRENAALRDPLDARISAVLLSIKSQGESCLSDLALDRALAGEELNEGEAVHLHSCSSCRAQVGILQQEQKNAQDLVHQIVRKSVFESARRSRQQRFWLVSLLLLLANWLQKRDLLPIGRIFSRTSIKWGPSRLATVMALGSGILVATVALQVPLEPNGLKRDAAALSASEVTPTDTIRTKGNRLQYYVRRNDAVYPGKKIHRFQKDDAIQFVLEPGAPVHFLLLGISETGEESVYFPLGGKLSAFIDGEAEWMLPHSLVLDESVETEIVVAFLSPSPIRLEEIQTRLQRRRGSISKPTLNTKSIEAMDLPGEVFVLEIRRE